MIEDTVLDISQMGSTKTEVLKESVSQETLNGVFLALTKDEAELVATALVNLTEQSDGG